MKKSMKGPVDRAARILHAADIHFDRENRIPALASLRTLAGAAREKRADLVVIAGDLFNRGVQNSWNSGLPELVSVVLDLLETVPVVVVEGTPTHDLPGCYDVFSSLRGGHAFTVVRRDVPYFLSRTHAGHDVFAESHGNDDALLILGTGEPSREWFLTGRSDADPSPVSSLVENGMKRLFRNAAELRKRHANLPCLYVYHGLVEGARLPSGTALHSGDIRPGREDFLSVGADYYAFGHVHRAQRIPGIPAWYPGSAYPVSWGETDAKGFLLVEIPLDPREGSGESRPVKVRSLQFPHNRRKKLVVRLPGRPEGYEGYQTWVEYVGTKEELSSIDPERERLRLLSGGALKGSRVTRTTLPSVNPRAPTIRTAKTLTEKLEIYGRISGNEYAEGVREKAALLEREIGIPGRLHRDVRLRIRKLVLRGAVGIWKGLGRDQVELDLDAYDGGILSLSGRNGAGKTTLLENLHPFPAMLTRGGALSSHFRLKDSFRDLVFSDEITGTSYRSLMLIDATLAQPRSEFFLLRNDNGDWKSMTTGRLREYEEAVTGLFGSLRLFLKSAFIPQKSSSRNPDLVEAGPFERKALFRELAGLDYLAGYAEVARERSRGFEDRATVLGARIPVLERELARGDEARTELYGLTKRKEVVEEELRDLLEKESELARTLEAIRDELEEQNILLSRIRDIELRKEKTGSDLRQAADSAASLYGLVAERESLEAASAMLERLSGREKTLLALRAEAFRKKNELTEAFSRTEREFLDSEKKLGSKLTEIDALLFERENERKNREAAIGLLDAELAAASVAPGDTCPTCGSPLSEEKRAELRSDRERRVSALGEQRAREVEALEGSVKECGRLAEIRNRLSEELGRLSASREEAREDHLKERASIDSSVPEQELRDVQAELRRLAEERVPERTAAVREAQVRTLEFERTIRELGNVLEELSAEERSFRGRLSRETLERRESVGRELALVRGKLDGARETSAGLSAQIVSAERRLHEAEAYGKELLDVRNRFGAELREADDWARLSSACGPDGIQALELDALSPSIAFTANTLLETAYGRRFLIEFRTTREAGRGRTARTIEDFEIVVHDTLYDSEQPLDTLSGGETVWIRKAIFDAFGIIRGENTGLVFLTNFQDEADGALDPEARFRFLRLLEAAHHESGRHQTIIISHSTEIQEAVRQNIELESLPSGEKPDRITDGEWYREAADGFDKGSVEPQPG